MIEQSGNLKLNKIKLFKEQAITYLN